MTNFGRTDPEKRRAHEILDMVRDGRMVSSGAITAALDFLGDLDNAWVRGEPPAESLLPSQLEPA